MAVGCQAFGEDVIQTSGVDGNRGWQTACMSFIRPDTHVKQPGGYVR